MTFNPPEWVFWVLLSLGILVAVSLAYHEVRMRSVELETEQIGLSKKPALALTKPKKYLHADHSVALWGIVQKMEKVHGHSDIDGLRADAKDGVLVSDLLSRNCTRCGKPRNQQGDDVDE